MWACQNTLNTSILSRMLQMSGYLSCVSRVSGKVWRNVERPPSGNGSGGTHLVKKIAVVSKKENISSRTESKLISRCVIHS